MKHPIEAFGAFISILSVLTAVRGYAHDGPLATVIDTTRIHRKSLQPTHGPDAAELQKRRNGDMADNVCGFQNAKYSSSISCANKRATCAVLTKGRSGYFNCCTDVSSCPMVIGCVDYTSWDPTAEYHPGLRICARVSPYCRTIRLYWESERPRDVFNYQCRSDATPRTMTIYPSGLDKYSSQYNVELRTAIVGSPEGTMFQTEELAATVTVYVTRTTDRTESSFSTQKQDQPVPPPGSPVGNRPPIGIIVGGTVGGLVFLIFNLIGIYLTRGCWGRRKKVGSNDNSSRPESIPPPTYYSAAVAKEGFNPRAAPVLGHVQHQQYEYPVPSGTSELPTAPPVRYEFPAESMNGDLRSGFAERYKPRLPTQRLTLDPISAC